jgi:hypothetical protein
MLTWKGDQVLSKTILAAGRAVNGCAADIVTDAKSTAPVKTSAYQGSIQARPAYQAADNTVMAQLGSFGINYAMIIERGSPAHVIMPVNKKALSWPGAMHPVRMVFHPGTAARNILENAFNRHAPSLPLRIKMEFGE